MLTQSYQTVEELDNVFESFPDNRRLITEMKFLVSILAFAMC